ncbi:hypothetical protein ACWKWU_21555 [Chitinophaga lutea]
MQYKTLTIVFAAVSTLFFAACKKESSDRPTENDNEEITTVRLTFTNEANAADKVVAVWKTLTGANPTIDKINLKANSVYHLETELLDERKNPADDITEEVKEEGVEHRVFHLFFQNAGGNVQDSLSNVGTVAALDKDANNLPLGLESRVTTKNAFTGYFRMVVRHQPVGKDGSYAPGSTDALAEYPIEIK